MIFSIEKESYISHDSFSFIEATESPLFISSPHSGRVYPSQFINQTKLPFLDLQKMEDRFVDQILEDVPHNDIGLIKALFARSYCDVNRNWRELDPILFTPPLDAKNLLITQRVQAGYGVIPRCVGPGKVIYSHTLPVEDAEKRLGLYWSPFHTKLYEALSVIYQKFGFAVLFDIHSMPPLFQTRKCDIVLGNRHGRSCSPALLRFVQLAFEERGYNVQINSPYAGGFITHYYGMPHKHFHSLQIEICRSLYLNHATLALTRHFQTIKDDMTSILCNVSRWLLNEENRKLFL
ncbi:N-formylglutamate deformylase [Aristophania vespae]|uniref:N-formylglutamate deformylase n=1 Tax=Aristophania vespae TaxID=2697033 RepID=A0A6P1NDL4_9PROT|nr:N-formylglutamate amidohydrolase [Aristophania vespae]QHI95553.1 N-formylglutamate deformylase [Aristophania vespae]